MVDMSLVCKTGEAVKCHKIVLAAASSMLRSVLEESTGEVRDVYVYRDV